MTMEWLLELDFAVFRWINHDLSSPMLDSILILLRNKYLWIPLYFAIITYLLAKYRIGRAMWYLFFIVSSVFITDTVSSHIIKEIVQRPRPCYDITVQGQVVKRSQCNYSYSFTSTHATNHFGLALMLSLLLFHKRRGLQITLFVWALLISLSQVYVGLHYPLDIVGGALLGFLLIRLYLAMLDPLLSRLDEEHTV